MRRFLSQDASKRLDDLLVSHGFSIDQLMELAGLSVAQCVSKEFPPSRILILCGPGNNGGDGLVAARHLKLFGFQPEVYYPKRTASELYTRLVRLLDAFRIPVHDSQPAFGEFPVFVDAIFGFSFRGAVREPFAGIIAELNNTQKPVVSVDIPSGWDVELGNQAGTGVSPSVLVSLSAPKACAQFFPGTHYVGGRFVPQCIADELNFDLPEYPGCDEVVKVSNP